MFASKKKTILEQLELPAEEYYDSSPKGSIDEPIQDLIREINAKPNLVTTSSCSGRIAVYLEGERCKPSSKGTSPGGKGGGKWLFVSHEPLDITNQDFSLYSLFNMESSQAQGVSVPLGANRFVHFKFEAMILHILTASLHDAQQVLASAIQAGFRESGAINLTSENHPTTPLVAVRSSGLGFDCLVGYVGEDGNMFSFVSENYLRLLVQTANKRFKTNMDRISRFQSLLLSKYEKISTNHPEKLKNLRDSRKREESVICRKQELQTAGHDCGESSFKPSEYPLNLNILFD